MFHEVRNVSSAMAINYETLVRSGQLDGNKNFEALGALVGTLRRVAAAELKQSATGSEANAVNLGDVLTDLRLVLDPYCEEAGIESHWDIPAALPSVWAERHRLLQVLLNLMRNGERALANSEVRRIDVTAAVSGDVVSIRVTDTGPGLEATNHLFEPFQQGADATGLGLYLSRALMRSFQGDLRYDPTTPGCSFAIELMVVHSPEGTAGNAGRTDADDTHSVVVG